MRNLITLCLFSILTLSTFGDTTAISTDTLAGVTPPYQQLFTFDGERFPGAASLDYQLDLTDDHTMKFNLGGTPITLKETEKFLLALGGGYYYQSLAPADSVMPAVAQSISVMAFVAGHFKEKWWWFTFAQYGFNSDIIFEDSPFDKDVFTSMYSLGYRLNHRITFGLSLSLVVGSNDQFLLLPLPVFRAALVPMKLWLWVGPTPETGISYRPINKIRLSTGYRLGSETWITQVADDLKSFSHMRQSAWLSFDVKVAPLVWLYVQGDLTTKRSSSYGELNYTHHGTTFLSMGVRFTPDWQRNPERDPLYLN